MGRLMSDFGKNELPPELAAQILEREAAAAVPGRGRPDLDPAVLELLDFTSEECAEAIQAASKVKRFGLDENPYTGVTNRESLEHELGDVVAGMAALCALDVIDLKRVVGYGEEKFESMCTSSERLSESTRALLDRLLDRLADKLGAEDWP